jgi:hypothetical protein
MVENLLPEERLLLNEFLESECADSFAKNNLQEELRNRLWEAHVWQFLKLNSFKPTSKDAGSDFKITHNNQIIHIQAIAPKFEKQIKEFKEGDSFE